MAYKFEVMELHVLAVSDDGNEESGGCGDCDWEVDEVSLDDLVAIDGGINLRVGLKGEGAGLKEERHESQLDIIFFQELFTQFLSKRNCTFLVLVASLMSISWKVVSMA